jgi:UDP-2-acetamido-2,6-beta-L-arabino-hexul-4-ose reductase
MTIVVTGAHGFIGQNLVVRLAERGQAAIAIGSGSTEAELRAALEQAEFVFHLAGVNRPQDDSLFQPGNVGSTERICDMLRNLGRAVPIVYASSIQAERDNAYGRSKRAAEGVLQHYARSMSAPVSLFRLPNVFGKWARPNYNSAVATFCYNTTRGLDITVNDPAAPLSLVYIDDVCDAFLAQTAAPIAGAVFVDVTPVYRTTVGEVAELIEGFARNRRDLMTDRVGSGFIRALHSTYLSYLEPEAFAYDVPRHADTRGVFVEMLKTPDCGQFSYFTAGPGVTRGQHYHHTKTEKFLVLAGEARFGFRHIITNERHDIVTRGGEGRIVETIPGWTHDITNVGATEMVVMLWANEIFDRDRPDTISQKV